ARGSPVVAAPRSKNPGDQTGRLRFARRARDHDAISISRQLAPILRLADQSDVMLAGRLGFGVALAYLVTLDDEVRLSPAREVGRGVAVDPLDAGLGQDVRRRRVGVLVRASYVVAQLLGDDRQARNGIAADADEMDPHHKQEAASSRPATSSAACGRPRERMAFTILLYPAGS